MPGTLASLHSVSPTWQNVQLVWSVQPCGIPKEIAVRETIPVAKEHAKYLAPSNSDNGVLRVLNEYLDKK